MKEITKNIIEAILLTIIIVMAIIGMVLSSIYIHEYSHMNDYKGEVFDDSLCIFSIPTNITWKNFLNGAAGYYSYSYNEDDRAKIEEIDKYTEIKATAGTIAIFIIMAGILNTYIYLRYNKKTEETKNENTI